MLEYLSVEEIIKHQGLRIVLLKGMPSPWGQAAKTMFEIKGLDYVAAPWLLGEPNTNIVPGVVKPARPSSPGPRKSQSTIGSTFSTWPNDSPPSLR
jgi:hypothetical protein